MSSFDKNPSPENEEAPEALQCSEASAGKSLVPQQDIEIVDGLKGGPSHGVVNVTLGEIGMTFCPNIKSPSDCSTILVDHYLQGLRDGHWRKQVEKMRAEEDEERRNAQKDLLPSVVPASIFKYRKANCAERVTGLAVLDFDDAEDVPGLIAKLAALPFTVIAHVSCSGTGAKAFVRLPAWVDSLEKFESVMPVAMLRVEEMVGAKVDPSGKDICRACYVSYDPHAYFNPDATPFPLSLDECPVVKVSAKKQRAAVRALSAASSTRNRARVESAVRYLASQGRPDYALWILIIAAVKLVMPKEEGVIYLREVLPEDEENEYLHKWDKALDRITVEGFLATARDRSWNDDPTLGISEQLKTFLDRAAYSNRKFYVLGANGFLVLDQRGYSRHLKEAGVETREHREALTTWSEKYRSVDAVLEIAGCAAGILEVNGMRVLVPKSWKLAEARPGKHGLILRILSEMLGDTQLSYLLGWLRHGRLAYRNGSTAPGQMLVIAGPVGCGKTLACTILTQCLGGRRADAVRYLTGDTAYNRELVAAGVLVADDGFLDLGPSERAKLKSRIKTYLYARSIELHAKFADSVSLPVTTRLIVALNDTAEALGSLPARAPDIEDKVLLLKAAHVPQGTLETMKGDDNALMAAINIDLPGFLHHVDSYTVPAELYEARSGVKPYWHPELVGHLDASDELSPLIEVLESHRGALAGIRTTRDILAALAPDENVDYAAIVGPGGGRVSLVQLGRQLAKVAAKYPDLIESAGERNRAKRWRINAARETTA